MNSKIDYLAKLAQISSHIQTCINGRPLGLMPNNSHIIYSKIKDNVDKEFLNILLQDYNKEDAFKLQEPSEEELEFFSEPVDLALEQKKTKKKTKKSLDKKK